MVFYREQSSSSWTKSDVKLDYSLELTNLVTGKHYTVCVAGYTKVGRGVKSPQIQNIVVGGKIYFLCKKGPVKMSLTKSIVPVFMTQIKMSFTTGYIITPPLRASNFQSWPRQVLTQFVTSANLLWAPSLVLILWRKNYIYHSHFAHN